MKADYSHVPIRYSGHGLTIRSELRYPIGVNWEWEMNGAKPFVTLCLIVYEIGGYTLAIPPSYYFDGASIPRVFHFLKGFSPLDRSILAALPHDFTTDFPKVLPRTMADGLFLTVLRAIGVPLWRAALMYVAVRGWSVRQAIKAYRTHDVAKTMGREYGNP